MTVVENYLKQWITVELGEVCTIERGITFPASDKREQLTPSTIACLRTSNVQEDVDWDDLIYVPRKYVNADSKLVRRSDILISLANSANLVGKVSYVSDVPVESTFGGFISVIRSSELVLDPFYLYSYLNSRMVQELLHSRASQTTNIANLTTKDLTQVTIPLPPLPEQRRIVAILSKANELRQLRRQANARAQELLPALFHRMFGLHWKTWPQGKIGDIIYFETGKSISAHPFPAQENKWGILKVSAVTIGEFRPEENKELPDDATFDPSFEVRHGDLLVSRANTTELVGASALVYNPPPRLIIPDKLWRAVPKVGVDTNFAFLHAVFNLSEIRREISRRATGTSASMKNISQEKFLDIDIPIPSPTEQHKYGRLSQLYRSQIFADENKTTEKFDQLFNSFLARAFTGELTTDWHEAHTAELAQAAAERDRLLSMQQPVITGSAAIMLDPITITATATVKTGRAIYADLDTSTQSLLAATQARSAYFRPADLINGNDLSAVQAEAGLRVLEALGFVRQVGLDGQLVYRRVDPIGESAPKPALLQ